MERLKILLFSLWQLPQNLIGLLLSMFYRGDMVRTDVRGIPVRVCFSRRMRGGVSLGQFVVVPDKVTLRSDFVKHELGHCRQSQCLGWLYLFVIGLPSIVWACIYTCSKKVHEGYSYYWFYTERSADRLGGVRGFYWERVENSPKSDKL